MSVVIGLSSRGEDRLAPDKWVAAERISLTARALGCAWLGLAVLCEAENENEPRPAQVNKQPVADQKATKDFDAGVVGTKRERERKVQVQV
jgi:hypothetical protein